MKKEPFKQVKLNPTVDSMLKELSKFRLENDFIVHTKQGIVAELILKCHQKEIKKGGV